MDFARDTLPFKLAAAALVFLAALLFFRALYDSPSLSAPGDEAIEVGTRPDATTEQRIEALKAQAAESPSDPDGFVSLGSAYLTRINETEDPSLYAGARSAYDQALALEPGNLGAIAGLAQYQLSRHHFREGLALALRARRINRSVAHVDGLITDAQIELGRYAAAERTLTRYGRRRPELSSYSRISYYRELHGDLVGALEAMRLAASAAGEASPSAAYAQILVGKLEADRGDYAAAEATYRGVLAVKPDAPDALLGLAAIEAGRGDLESAIERQRAVLDAIPAPDHAILLGESYELAGDLASAREAYEEAAVSYARLKAAGVNVTTELAIFEADHGDVARAVAIGRHAWRATPSVRGADAYSWALSAAGRDRAALAFSRRAMRLGSLDPAFLYHAGIVAKRAGAERRARAFLGRLLARTPAFSPLRAPRARAALASLD